MQSNCLFHFLGIDEGGHRYAAGEGQLIGGIGGQVVDLALAVGFVEGVLMSNRSSVLGQVDAQIVIQLAIDPVQTGLVGSKVIGNAFSCGQAHFVPVFVFIASPFEGLSRQFTGNGNGAALLVAELVGYDDVSCTCGNQEKARMIHVAAAHTNYITISSCVCGSHCAVGGNIQLELLVHCTGQGGGDAPACCKLNRR